MTRLVKDENACSKGGACIKCEDAKNMDMQNPKPKDLDKCAQEAINERGGESMVNQWCNHYPPCKANDIGKRLPTCRVVDAKSNVKRGGCVGADRLCLTSVDTTYSKQDCELDSGRWRQCLKTPS